MKIQQDEHCHFNSFHVKDFFKFTQTVSVSFLFICEVGPMLRWGGVFIYEPLTTGHAKVITDSRSSPSLPWEANFMLVCRLGKWYSGHTFGSVCLQLLSLITQTTELFQTSLYSTLFIFSKLLHTKLYEWNQTVWRERYVETISIRSILMLS